MNEFKVIPQAPDYKINAICEVRRVSNDKPLLILDGRKVLLKIKDGTMKHFSIEDLSKELFGDITTTSKNMSTEPVLNINSEENATNESEDANLVKDEPLTNKIKRGRGRPAKPKDPNAPIKVKGKRGRPAGSKNKAK